MYAIWAGCLLIATNASSLRSIRSTDEFLRPRRRRLRRIGRSRRSRGCDRRHHEAIEASYLGSHDDEILPTTASAEMPPPRTELVARMDRPEPATTPRAYASQPSVNLRRSNGERSMLAVPRARSSTVSAPTPKILCSIVAFFF